MAQSWSAQAIYIQAEERVSVTHNINQEKEIGQKKGEFFYPTFSSWYFGVYVKTERVSKISPYMQARQPLIINVHQILNLQTRGFES